MRKIGIVLLILLAGFTLIRQSPSAVRGGCPASLSGQERDDEYRERDEQERGTRPAHPRGRIGGDTQLPVPHAR